MTNYIKSLKDEENNISFVISNVLKRITFIKTDSNHSFKYFGNEIIHSSPFRASFEEDFKEWLRNLNLVMIETKNLINQLILYISSENKIPSYRKILVLIGEIKNKFTRLKIIGKKKYDHLCAVEKNFEVNLDIIFDPNKLQDIEIPPLCSFEDHCSKKLLKTDETHVLSNDSPIINNKPIVIGQFVHNWHVKDQEIFLRIYRKVKDDNKRLEKLMQLLPHISKEQIVFHHEKYISYCKCVEETKSKITEWKTKRQMCVDNTIKDNEKDCAVKQPKEYLQLIQNKRQETKMQIEKWRNKKNVNKNLVAAKVQQNNKKSLSYTDEERECIKQKLKIYKAKKSVSWFPSNENTNFNDKKLTVKRNLYELRQKDKAFILQRKSQIYKINKRKRSPQKSSQSSIGFRYSPENHRKLTVSAKCHINSKKSLTSPPVSVDFIPKLKVPQWKYSGT